VRHKCLWTLVFSLPMACAYAQEPHTYDFKGSIHSETDLIYHGYVVELSGTAQHETWKSDVMSDGTFVVREIPDGDYLLRVKTYQGAVLKEQFVSVHGVATTVDVLLPAAERTAPGGPVSLRELQHPPAAKALRAAAAAQRFSQEGEDGKAVEELQKAIRISPDFAAAHSNLAAEYIRMKNYTEARQEIQRALEITGPDAVDLCNLAFLDTAEHRIPQALDNVKAALRADPSNANAHYILGTLLLLDKRTAEEGVRHLERAAQTVPGARLMLSKLRGQ
jgi:tetratricopeptide (TPR) repeat protein